MTVAVVGFHAYINKMHGSRSKSPVIISSGSVARRDLILALKGYNLACMYTVEIL
jgi:hypothetical protein